MINDQNFKLKSCIIHNIVPTKLIRHVVIGEMKVILNLTNDQNYCIHSTQLQVRALTWRKAAIIASHIGTKQTQDRPIAGLGKMEEQCKAIFAIISLSNTIWLHSPCTLLALTLCSRHAQTLRKVVSAFQVLTSHSNCAHLALKWGKTRSNGEKSRSWRAMSAFVELSLFFQNSHQFFLKVKK